MRGLKQRVFDLTLGVGRSHPTWVRGLKPTKVSELENDTDVAPYVGAWIETCLRTRTRFLLGVAPYVGAWIETFGYSVKDKKIKSHPTWVRGLKLHFLIYIVIR